MLLLWMNSGQNIKSIWGSLWYDAGSRFFGTSAVVAKEKLLQIFRKKIARAYGLEAAGAACHTSSRRD